MKFWIISISTIVIIICSYLTQITFHAIITTIIPGTACPYNANLSYENAKRKIGTKIYWFDIRAALSYRVIFFDFICIMFFLYPRTQKQHNVKAIWGDDAQAHKCLSHSDIHTTLCNFCIYGAIVWNRLGVFDLKLEK